jgi:hypothetical protein
LPSNLNQYRTIAEKPAMKMSESITLVALGNASYIKYY